MRRLLILTAILAVPGCASGVDRSASNASYNYASSTIVSPAPTDRVVTSTASASNIAETFDGDDD